MQIISNIIPFHLLYSSIRYSSFVSHLKMTQNIKYLHLSEAAGQRCFEKNGVLKISENRLENICSRVSIFANLQELC